MKTKLIRNVSALIGCTLLAASCIQVDNVENAWKHSKADSELLGVWKGNDGRCAFIKTEKDYFITAGPNQLEGGCKSFEVAGHKYVIVASLQPSLLGFEGMEEDAKGGTLLRYEVKGDTLTMYSLEPDKITQAIKAKQVPGVIEDDNGRLTELDRATIQWLGKVASEDGWKPNVYKRVK